MKYDEMLSHMGEFGPFQKKVVALLILPCALCPFQIMISVFVLAVPQHRCKLPSMPNDTWAIQGPAHIAQINESIPIVPGPIFSTWSQCRLKAGNSSHTEACTEWVYDTSTFDSTAVTKFDWVCEEKAYRSHAIMAFMFGMLLGGAIFGPLGDVLGRKITFLMGAILVVISGYCMTVAPDFYTLSILRMISAIGNMPLYMSSFNMGMELVGISRRVLVAQLLTYAFTVGSVVLTGVAYLIRDWVILEIVATTPVLLFGLYWWILPESPRWLIARGRKQEAEVIVRHAAAVNGKTLPPDIFDDIILEGEGPRQPTKDKLWHMFYTPILALRTVTIFFAWMVTTMMYYGISLSAGNYHGNIYVNFLLCALAEVPAYAIVLLFVDRTGRKRLLVTSFLCGGLGCVASIFPALYAPHLTSLTLVMALIGKMCASITFGLIYMYSAELFPTVLRASAMGACFMFARVGSIVSPYITDLGELVGGNVGAALPLLTFGGMAVLAAILTLVLPETTNRLLPETVEDALNFGRQVLGLGDVEIKTTAKFDPSSDEKCELCPFDTEKHPITVEKSDSYILEPSETLTFLHHNGTCMNGNVKS